MKALSRKLWRDLWRIRGQALAITLVIMSGVATYVMFISTVESLTLTRDSYYREYRFPEVFASLKRAPENLRSRIAAIPGVNKVETRVVAAVNLDVEGFADPVTGQIISIPDFGKSLLNRLYLRQGRFIAADRHDEVLVAEDFAQAHGFSPGDTLRAIIKGRAKTLTIVGIALSPESVYQIPPGGWFPDPQHYGVLWMGRTALASAYDMEGAFNDVVLTLSADGQLGDIVDRLDTLLERYGGLGAYGREQQVSHRYLAQEFKGLEELAAVFPLMFLGVAAFLLNVVISRLIYTQREQMAALKAFGYSNLDIGSHYFKLVSLIVLIGVASGVAMGVWLGHGLSEIYMRFFRFPVLHYELRPAIAVTAALMTLAAGLLGTLYAVRQAVRLSPAQAMRPEPPAEYRTALIERLGLQRLFSQPSRMIARHIERRPLKALLSITGIAFACAIMMTGRFQEDSVTFMVDVQYGLSQRQDLAATFVEPTTSKKALYVLQSQHGVEYGEVYRSVPARLHFQHRSYRGAIQGIEPGGDLQRLLDTTLQPVQVPTEGILLGDYLGKTLGIRPGDRLTVEVLEGSRPVRQVSVAGLVSEYVGMSAYMERSALNRLMREGDVVSGAYLATDKPYQAEVYKALKEMPRVAGTAVRASAIKSFYETMSETILFFTFIATLFAGVIAFGVVYNTTRIALIERGRELASLRVLGLTRGEIFYILSGELGLYTLVAIPIGFLIGRNLCAYIAYTLESELYRVPVIVEPSTYALAASVVLLSACISALIIWRKLARLDLVGVLKTKE